MTMPAFACLLLLAAARAEAEASAPGPEQAETPTAPDPAEQAWHRQHRRFQARAGVAWSFTAIGLLGMAIPLASLATCRTRTDTCETFGALVAVPIFAAITAAALVPAVIVTDRLVEHRRRRPRVRVLVAPGGISLGF